MRHSVATLKRAAAFCAAALLFCVVSADAAPRRGQPAPAFKAFAISGQPISSAGLKGSVVILDFWATCCPPCRESIPFLAELHRKYAKQGLQVIGMSVDEGGERIVKEYVQEHKIPYPIVMVSSKVTADYGVRALPVLYLIDQNGVVREQIMGFAPGAERVIEGLVKKQLAEIAR
jgi:thiol-disulfide isomerase/thioredoxin